MFGFNKLGVAVIAPLLALSLAACEPEDTELVDDNGNSISFGDDGIDVDVGFDEDDDNHNDDSPNDDDPDTGGGDEPDGGGSGELDLAFCDAHNPHLMPGVPDVPLCRETYSVGYNVETKQADWVSYSVTADSVGVFVERTDDFREDDDIPESGRSTLDHYRGSGYDRGHMAPAATTGTTESTMSDTFLLSNMSPQTAQFNRFGWADLEAAVRDCVYQERALLVVTGPVVSASSPVRIGGDGPVVPDAYYKFVMTVAAPYQAFAVLIPHEGFTMQQLSGFVVSPDELEAATGLDFVSGLDDEIEDAMEAESVDFCGMTSL